jgi:hypothetical protein
MVKHVYDRFLDRGRFNLEIQFRKIDRPIDERLDAVGIADTQADA